MNIGNIQFGERPLFLAPMEDVTDIGFRHLCKRFGASMVYTEFVSAEALVRSVNATLRKLTISDEERPVGIQIYGRDVESMVEAAKIVEQVKPDVIDINFGCPVKKVAGKGAGAGMLQNIPLLLDITREVVKAVNTPVTVKTRLGWNHDQLVICDLAEALQDCGIQALTIHGRTRAQMYNVERIDEYRGILHTRRHIAASPVFKGIPDFRQTRIAMLRATTVEELTTIMEQAREMIHKTQGV